MREFTLKSIEPLIEGLREDSRKRLGSRRLVEAKNVVVTPDMLEGYTNTVDPYDGGLTVSWPFPQLLKGEEVTLLCGETAITPVDTSTDPFSGTAYSLVAPATGDPATIAGGGGQWHFADGGYSWLLCNGTTVVFRGGLPRLSGTAEKIYAASSPFGTCCFGAGRFVLGNLTSSFWSAMTSIFNVWDDDLPAGVAPPTNETGQNWIAYSSIGGGDLPFWLLYPTGFTYDLSVTADVFIQRLKENSLGWMPMPFSGAVMAVKKLGKNVIVYGEDGVTALVAYSGNQLGEASPVFGRRVLLKDVGILKRGAVGGDEFRHVFLDSLGRLWQLKADLSLDRLGYEEYLVDLLDAEVAIAYDEEESKFYIGGGSTATSFLLSPTGLTETKERVTSGFYFSGGFVAVAEDIADTEVLIVTEEFDLALRSIKRLTFVQLGILTDYPVTVAVDYRYNKADAFTRSRFVPVNREGVAYVNVSGTEFRLVIKCTNYADFVLDYAEIGYQTSDKRSIRGPNVDTTGSRSRQ